MERQEKKAWNLTNIINKLEQDKEDFKKDFEEFILHWEKEAEDLRNKELTEDDSRYIQLNFKLSKTNLAFIGITTQLL